MTTPSFSTPHETGDHFDTGPLSWVMGEIREALTRSKTSLIESVGLDADGQSAGLRQAKTYLHQAHGALQIVDVDGLSLITETVEDLFERVEAGQLQLSAGFAHTVENAYHALLEYLEELLSGAPHQPVRLFPYYRALLEVKGAERIHPADLFFPNLGVRPQLPASNTDEPADYLGLRKRFERVLLPFLKSSGTTGAAQAAAMRDIIGDVQRAQKNTHARAFWWVMQGFSDVVASGQFDSDVYIKQLFARINLQIRRLSEGSSSIAERLLRDALFFVARAEKPSAQVRQIKTAYGLDGLVPSDYQKQRYGRVDVDALRAAKDRLLQAKNIWNRIAGGDASGVASFESEMQALTAASTKLNAPPLSALLKQMSDMARHAATASTGPLGLEVATSLLFVENALSNISHLPDDFAERSEAMSARLRSIVAGQNPTESAEWLDDISRQAQQRQTMAALSSEMQTSLRHVEKILDEYFRDPTQRDNLNQVDGVLHQLEGAFSILDQDDAVDAIRHTKEAVHHFMESEEIPDVKEFQQVAQNVGALSFFIESLQLQSDQAKKRFAFDRALGVLKTNLLERKTKTESAPTIEIEPQASAASPKINTPSAKEDESGPFPTVEDELAQHQRQSSELASSLSAEPHNPQLQEQLKESLERVRRDATLIDNPEANDRAQAAIKMMAQPDFVPTQDALANIISGGAAPVAAPAPTPIAAPSPETDEAVDAELLEIFLGEAEEVLECVRETIPQSRNEPYNQDHLTTLRRSFHTLKGSGRMVGLTVFGEAAWGIEQVLNLRLSETRAGDVELYSLLEKSAEILGVWVEDLKTQGRSDRTATALINAAERVKAGGTFVFDELADETPAEVPMIEPVVADANDDFVASVQEVELDTLAESSEAELDAPLALPEAEEIELSDADMAALRDGTPFGEEITSNDVSPEPISEYAPQDAVVEAMDFATPETINSKLDDNVKQIGSLQISVPLYNIYLAETDDLVRVLSQDVAEWRHEPERPVHIPTVHATHSLAGSSATVGFTPLQEIAHALEMVLQSLARKPVRLNNEDFDTLDHSIERIRYMLQMFALGEMPEHEPHQAEILDKMLRDIETRMGFSPDMIAAVYADPVIEPEIEAEADRELDLQAEQITPPVEDAAEQMDESTTQDEPTIAVDEPQLDEKSTVEPLAQDELIASVDELAHVEPEILIEPPQIMAPIEMIDVIRVAPEENAEPHADVVVTNPVAANDNQAETPAQSAIIRDDLDADLLPVFLEEGRDMLPQIAETLRGWQSNPQNIGMPQSLLRLLHTVKGSARMAGAMMLGQHMHDMETRIEHLAQSSSPQLSAIEDLQSHFDHGLQMFEQLLNPNAPPPVAPVAAAAPAADVSQPVVLHSLMPTAKAGSFVAAPIAKPVSTAHAAVATSLVRVRADILDRLVNQAGEVSISRSKLETEVGTIRQSLTELNENVARLRDQLREIEMQAESQISSRMSQSGDREFDPLEFDRYTRLQELTRMMAESVNDVSSVQQNLARTVDSANSDLTTQARLTRDLQQDLMRVRMVQFSSISERLYRVTRQASKEINKRVNLDIRGSSVEIDRGVLERMTGPFEHILRNAIVHGIESREARQAAGKSEIGEMLVEIRQEGNEVVIHFSDDGQGLNLARIREKAISTGLLESDVEVSDAEVTDLIFHPGFSTVEKVTELAGRGVGTDVVRSEAAALGGRVAVFSETGKGAHFTIHLPLTLAVTQVVLLSAGGKQFAVPSVLVEQVQQLKINPLTAAYNDGAVIWQGQRVPLHYLSTLLGDTDATPVAQQYSPILILRSGNDRVALHVDAVQGNREVVVKNIGPQLARMIGIAGATVMGSGDIVLILNPVPLAQRLAQENLRAPRITSSDAPNGMGAVAEMASGAPSTPQSEPVQGLRTQHIVMVVDDSLTVRRVTQRLLTREGYQVVLAKDGVDALEHLQSITPDVMLVDIEMPRMDGFDLTRNVRGDERTRHIPIIMITSRTATKHRNYALELGVNEYLGKPYQEDILLKQIAGFVGKETPVA